MPLPSFSGDIEKNIIRHIKYRGTVRTGEVIADNGDGTYDVKIALSDETYPDVETIHYDMKFEVGEIAVLAFEYGSKELPKIIGHSKKIAQVPVEVEVGYSGTARVETLDAYSILAASAYLEGRIHLGGAGDCTERGFYYGTSTGYGDGPVYTTGSFGSGSYNKQVTDLTGETTYHFQAYILDADGDEQIGEDKTMTTSTISYKFYETQLINDGNWMSAYDTRWIAYFFQAESTHNVTKIYLYMTRKGYPGTVTVSLYPNEGTGNFKPVIGGGALTSGTTDGNTLPTSGGEWREFSVTSYSLTSGTWYSIVIKASGGDTSNYASWWGTNENVAPDQWRHTSPDSGTNWYSGAFDLTYKIYG